MVGDSYGKGITVELARKLGVLDSTEGFVPGPAPDSPMKALRAADVPAKERIRKTMLAGLGGDEVHEDHEDHEDHDDPDEDDVEVKDKPTEEPANKWCFLTSLIKLLLKVLGDSDTGSSSGQFREGSGQFRP